MPTFGRSLLTHPKKHLSLESHHSARAQEWEEFNHKHTYAHPSPQFVNPRINSLVRRQHRGCLSFTGVKGTKDLICEAQLE